MNKELTVVQHLDELCRRILVSAISVILLGIFAFPFSSKVLTFLKSPASGTIERLVFFSPQEAFLIHIKIAFFAGLVISMPFVLYQLWIFISPAIEYKAKRHGVAFLFYSLGAFILGAAFGFLVLVPAAIKFLLGFSQDTLQPLISASNYISFVLALTLGSGLVFEMPVLSFLLSRMGVINYRILRKSWKYAVIAIFIIAAVITPTADIFNMTILAVPMLILYEVSIWVSKFTGRKTLP